MDVYRYTELLSFSDGRGCCVVMGNGVMGDWEWDLNLNWLVGVEGDWEGNNYTSYSSGELIASTLQSVNTEKYNISKPPHSLPLL